MRIALDARHAARGLGVSTFVCQLARALVELGRHELVWLGDPAFAPPGVAEVVRADRWPYPALDGPLGRLLARRLGVDLMHFTGNTGWGRRGPVPSVLTLQDVIFLSTGRRGRSLRQILGHRYERVLVRRALPSATVLAVPSRTVADDVARRFPSLPSAHVVYDGVDAPAVLSQREDGMPYIVAFASRDARKRTVDVVDAWRSLAPLPVRLRLLAGAGLSPGLAGELRYAVQEGAVEILDYLPRGELWRVVSGALALAYPTAEEGFGLPVLEGMAAGTPVLSGLAPVTREVGGDAIVALDPHDVAGSIAREVRRLHADPWYASALVERGRVRAARFTWRRTAEQYEELYLDALERGGGVEVLSGAAETADNAPCRVS
jgi:glycosyltransferase involved in cell wall biosynthesis